MESLRQFAPLVARKACVRSADDHNEYVIVGKRGVLFRAGPKTIGWRYGGTFPGGRLIPTNGSWLHQLLRTHVARFGGDGRLQCVARGDTEAVFYADEQEMDLLIHLAGVRRRGRARGIALQTARSAKKPPLTEGDPERSPRPPRGIADE